jgi:hypothetical protein
MPLVPHNEFGFLACCLTSIYDICILVLLPVKQQDSVRRDSQYLSRLPGPAVLLPCELGREGKKRPTVDRCLPLRRRQVV